MNAANFTRIMAKSKKKHGIAHLAIINAANPTDLFPIRKDSNVSDLWTWGADNLFPWYLEKLARRNAVHRGIINSKADYISGRGFTYDDTNPALDRFVRRCNGTQSLREVMERIVYDRVLTGNFFLEIAIKGSDVLLFHQDATRCRLSQPDKDGDSKVVISLDWKSHNAAYDKTLPIFPKFEKDMDGVMRSCLHYADYEPSFLHYGVPSYIAGLTSARVGFKTANWNEMRIDNSFQPSGVLELTADENDDAKLKDAVERAKDKFAGKPGQVLFTVANEAGSSKFTPIQSDNDGDWLNLHNVSKNDMVTAHSWFISLAGLDYTTGISSDRMLNEYSVALSTIIEPEQAKILEILRSILNLVGIDGESLGFVNRAPILVKPTYMKVWEARKADGMDYDENDPEQQVYLANISQVRSIQVI